MHTVSLVVCGLLVLSRTENVKRRMSLPGSLMCFCQPDYKFQLEQSWFMRYMKKWGFV